MLQTGRYAFFDKEEMIPVKKSLTQLDAASLGVLECKLWVQQRSSAKAARVKGIADRLDVDACAAVSVLRFLSALQDGQINDLRKIMCEGDGGCSRASCQREILQWVYEVMVSAHLRCTSPSCMATQGRYKKSVLLTVYMVMFNCDFGGNQFTQHVWCTMMLCVFNDGLVRHAVFVSNSLLLA